MSTPKFIERMIGEKRQWRQYKARIKNLPENYRTAAEALERYLMYFGPADGVAWASMCEDLADLFEQSAASGTPIREIVGEDPVEFVEAFMQNYPKGQWIARERNRLINGIKRAAGEDSGQEEETV